MSSFRRFVLVFTSTILALGSITPEAWTTEPAGSADLAIDYIDEWANIGGSGFVPLRI